MFSKTNSKKGETIAFEQDGMVCMRWSDLSKMSEKIVSTLSTKHAKNIIDSGKRNRTGDAILKPAVIADYTKKWELWITSRKLCTPTKVMRKGRK